MTYIHHLFKVQTVTTDVNGILSHKASLKNSGVSLDFIHLFASYTLIMEGLKKFMLGKLVDC